MEDSNYSILLVLAINMLSGTSSVGVRRGIVRSSPVPRPKYGAEKPPKRKIIDSFALFTHKVHCKAAETYHPDRLARLNVPKAFVFGIQDTLSPAKRKTLKQGIVISEHAYTTAI